MSSRSILAAAVLLVACSNGAEPITGSPGKGAESNPPVDGKTDSAAGVIEHSTPIQDLHEVGLSFTQEVRGHAYTFELGKSEHVVIHTDLFSGTTGPEVDTVLYLFKQGDNGWGHYLRRNDDDPSRKGSLWSRIEQDLEPGKYRILVKAFSKSARGDFGLNMGCQDGVCEWPNGTGGPDAEGVGTPDPVGTGTVSVSVPLLDEAEQQPLSRFNAQLSAAGLPTFPDSIVISSKSGSALLSELHDLAKQAARADVLAITQAQLLQAAPLGLLLDFGLCHGGDGAALPTLLGSLADSVLSDMFYVYGWKAENQSAYDVWHEPTKSSPVFDEWNASQNGVFLVWFETETDDMFTGTIPKCQ